MEEKNNNALEKVEKVVMANTVGKKPYPEVYGVNVVDSTQLEPTGVVMQQKDDYNKENYTRENSSYDNQVQAPQTKEERVASGKEKYKSFRKSNGHNGRRKQKGLVGAVVALSIVAVGLAIALAVTNLLPSTNDRMLEESYSRAFYDAVKQVDNVDLNLSKALVTKDKASLQKYLVDTAINSELCEGNLGELPLQDENKYNTTKLVNQIGDYAKYLNNKIIDGQTLTEQDYQMLKNLYIANQSLKASLHQTLDGMGDDFSMTSMMGGGNGNIVVKGFNDLENLSVNFPKMIYDGPFSDGQDDKEMKGLSGENINCEMAKENFRKIFPSYSPMDIICDSEVSGDVEALNVSATKDDEAMFAQFTKKGGKLILFSYSGSCKSVQIEEQTAIEKGQEFLQKLDIKDMKAVWINLANNVYTINFAYSQNDVVVYPDLIKVRVCAETGMVIGLEAKSYYTNHTERNIYKPALTKEQAKTYVFDGLNVENVALALVPVGSNSEKLCYEFFGESEGDTFYVYIDAITGRQVEMFKVIESTEGKLLT